MTDNTSTLNNDDIEVLSEYSQAYGSFYKIVRSVSGIKNILNVISGRFFSLKSKKNENRP